MTNSIAAINNIQNTRKIKALAFDLDGTLIDSLQDLTDAANAMRVALNFPPLPSLQIERHIGDGITRLVHRSLTNERHTLAEPALFEKGYALFLKYYGQNLTRHTRTYPGVIEGLSALKAARFPMVVITNKSEHFAIQILKQLNLEKYFKLVLGGESLPQKKPDALPLLHACEFLKIAATELAMVGDSKNDILAARNADALAVGVSYGFEDVTQYNPDIIIDSIASLPKILNIKESGNALDD